MEKAAITIIGGGVIGCAIAYELSNTIDDIVVIEKNSNIRGENQSSRNSGVIHSGVYYDKEIEPLKAKLCVEGNEILFQFCKEHNIPHKKTGKLIVATDQTEEEYLDDLIRIAEENNVSANKLSAERVNSYEPNVNASSGLLVPSTGIIDSAEYVNKLYQLSRLQGVNFLFGNEVIDINSASKDIAIQIKSSERQENFESGIVINAAGLYSDRIAKMLNPSSTYQIEPTKGEYAKFYQSRQEISINGLCVYPVPYAHNSDGTRLDLSPDEFHKLLKEGKIIRSLGMHLTPTLNEEHKISSTVTIGPSSVAQKDREDYRSTFAENFYLDNVNSFFPNLKLEDLSLHQTGIRAKLKGNPDFYINSDSNYSNFINLVGIDSPGLTSSLAIAKYVTELL